MHTIFTQSAQTQTQNNNMQHIEQHIQENTEHNTEQHTENRTQDTTICSAHNFSTYSFDLYHEYAYIKNSDTIELYTILQDKV